MLAFAYLTVDEAIQRQLRTRLVANVQLHEFSTRCPKRLEVGSERQSGEAALEIVPKALAPVRRVHHAVEVLPDVVFRDM